MNWSPDAANSAVDSCTERIETLGVHVTRDIADAGTLSGDNDKLRRVLINLIGNALDAFDEDTEHEHELQVQAGVACRDLVDE